MQGGHARFTGPIRVIVFCLVTIILPCCLLIAPLYIRYNVFKDVIYNLGESDLIMVEKPISTFWCEGHDLWMNATFHAYLLDEQPEISEDLQLFEMDKHLQLADDSLEYWGFFLLQGSKVILSVCSRYDGARLMVVKGTKNLKHCALLDPSPNPDQVDPWEDDVSAQGGEIKVTFQQGEHDIVQNQDGQYEDPRDRDNNGTSKGKGKRVYKTNRKTKDKTQQKGVQTAHESMKVNRHRHRPRGNRTEMLFTTSSTSTTITPSIVFSNDTETNRSKRYTEDDTLFDTHDYVTYDEHDDDNLENEEEDEDMPPNPVGVEADEMDLDTAGGRRDDETIDEEDIRSSGSSFAKNLWSCYGGDTLFTQSFSASSRCVSQDNMMKHAIRMRTVHEVTATGYFYYIFFSDNDIIKNDIFARFTIEKVVYNFPNYTHSCKNTTHCSFPLNFLSSEKVLLEVPLQDGVSDEDALAQMILISSCRPRLGVYFIFPVSIIFLILCCAFM
ncbi:uncharacterized protein LOC110846853 isoform X2 [Folsomia candida]|uniref:uncharacterized protein LOC110846853 isoform X2 n=1 Tax=Folsomia candida TaxID=158441 RepID=UPI001604DDC0|nr:uncharacterized protein LOC110846853 isoform X2 [Folsomia candida]